jgi:hypothetical protein
MGLTTIHKQLLKQIRKVMLSHWNTYVKYEYTDHKLNCADGQQMHEKVLISNH